MVEMVKNPRIKNSALRWDEAAVMALHILHQRELNGTLLPFTIKDEIRTMGNAPDQAWAKYVEVIRAHFARAQRLEGKTN
jgi:hypothetical protein